jgi:hypothetical protein
MRHRREIPSRFAADVSLKTWAAVAEFLRRVGLPESWADPIYRLHLHAECRLMRRLFPNGVFLVGKDAVEAVHYGWIDNP